MDSSHSSELHTKLQLVAEDVRFLKQQFNEAAEKKLDLYLPETDNEDAVRKRVDELVRQFISDTFEMSKHAMVVDGEEMGEKDLSQMLERDDDVEPFDLALNDKLRSVYAQVDDKTLEVTQLRRTVPFEATKNYNPRVDIPVSFGAEQVEGEGEDTAGEVPTRVQTDYTQALTLLSTLKQKVPDEFIELEKLQQTIDYLTKI